MSTGADLYTKGSLRLSAANHALFNGFASFLKAMIAEL